MIIRLIISMTFLMCSSLSFANTCFESDLKTYKYEKEIQPRWNLTVSSKQPVYFYSAPKNSCKLDDNFMIKNNQVIAYSLHKDEAQQEWVYVMYTIKDADPDDGDELIEGWVELKQFSSLREPIH